MANLALALLRGIAVFFINPIFYLLVCGLFLFSAQRVRRERRSFRVKAYGMFNTIFRSIAPSLITGLCGSVVLIGLGVSLKPGVFVLLTGCYLIVMLSTQLRFLSPAIAGGLTLLLAYFLPPIRTSSALLNQWITDIRTVNMVSLGGFLAVALLSECLLVYVWGVRQSSPRLINSRRGGRVGAHEASQLWIVPLFALVPSAGPISSFAAWPLIHGSGTGFGFLLFPIGIGLAQLITYALPVRAVRSTGHWLLLTACGFILCTVLALWLEMPVLVVLGGLLALISRLALLVHHHHLRKTRPFYFTQPNQGVRVIGVIPHSPVERMGIKPGEEILKVNDQVIKNEYEFYEALQKNLAYCKLEVVDRFGEPRFAKGSVHEGDGHRIGLLFLESDNWKYDTKTEA
ncbi:MAG: cell division protein [Sporolactobacillus sp.]